MIPRHQLNAEEVTCNNLFGTRDLEARYNSGYLFVCLALSSLLQLS